MSAFEFLHIVIHTFLYRRRFIRKKTFLDSAEEDYKGFLALCSTGCNNTAAFIAARTIEKYAKHILYRIRGISPPYDKTKDLLYFDKKTKTCKNVGHTTGVVLSLINKESEGVITADKDLRNFVRKVSPLNIQASYPDADNYHDISDEELAICIEAVRVVRSWCHEKESLLDAAMAQSHGAGEESEESY